MKYIVNSKEVSRNVFYFCQKAKKDNKSFVLLKYDNSEEIENYIDNNSQFDYYICDKINSYFVKGAKITEEWFEKYRGAPKFTPDEMKKKFEKSKCKTLTFEKWLNKNEWEHRIETRYEKGCFDIPTTEDFEEVMTDKLFSVKVNNDDTVSKINEIKEKYGDCIEYVLRTDACTEIIYKDICSEI